MSDLASAGIPRAGRPFSMGAAISRSFALFKQHLGKFAAIAAIGQAPPVIAVLATAQQGVQSGWGEGIANIVAFILSLIVQGAIAYGVIQSLVGKEFTIGQSLSAASSRLGALFLTSLVIAIAVMIGVLLLVVPGVILAMMFAVAIPVCIAERAGVGESLSRSRYLTKGSRWAIFGAFLTVGLLFVVAALIVGALVGLLIGAAPMAMALVELIVSALGSAFSSILVAVMYNDLRVDKDGVDTTQIASVFD